MKLLAVGTEQVDLVVGQQLHGAAGFYVLPWMVRLLSCPAPVAAMVMVPPAVTLEIWRKN